MKRRSKFGTALLLGAAVLIHAPGVRAQPVAQAPQQQVLWKKIVNNADVMPGTAANFNSYNQPSINSKGVVVFRARSKGGAAVVAPRKVFMNGT